jgi:hypothetical protein
MEMSADDDDDDDERKDVFMEMHEKVRICISAGH